MPGRDPDQELVERMLAPPPLEDARSSLEFWRQRQKGLPFYRRAARREAKEMTARWQETVLVAEQARFDASPIGRLLSAIGVSSLWLRRARAAKRLMVWLANAFTMRSIRLILGALALGLLLMVATLTALIVLIVQLA